MGDGITTRPKSPTRLEAMNKAYQLRPIYNTGVLVDVAGSETACIQHHRKSDTDTQLNLYLVKRNWVEDRTECPKGGSLYFPPKEEINYDEMKPESRQPHFRLNKLTGLQGNVKNIIKHDGHDGCGNYATANDLVYNHLPKPLCGPEQRYYKRAAHQYFPQPDLLKCYGNVTEWGLRKNMQHEWKCTNVSDYIASEYDDTYLRPQPQQYLQPDERKARNSSFTKTFRFKMTKQKTEKK